MQMVALYLYLTLVQKSETNLPFTNKGGRELLESFYYIKPI